MASQPRNRTSRAYWLRMFTWALAATVAVVVVFSGVTWRTPPGQMAEVFATSFLFSLFIAPPLGYVMPRIAHWVSCRIGFPWNWAVLIVAMVGVATAGSFAAILVLAAVGYLKGAGVVATWMAGSLKISIVITLTFGIVGTIIESMRSRLDEAALALRTKERDEAEARRVTAEAQLAAIEARVEPHFLFNTLNSIAALVHDDPSGAERMTGQLAALLRSALDSTAMPLVALDDELRVVRAYLDIERVRFGQRLRYAVEVANGAGRALVPRMSVQTLVENAVKYAVAPRREGASIAVRACASSDRLRVTVEDDGPGFDPARQPSGHGLDLLAQRLAMLFGATASLKIDSSAAGSRLVLDVPQHPATPNPQSPIPNP